MDGAKLGDSVRVHYTGSSGGETFDSSYARGEALEFTIGARQVVAGFESAVIGMSPGDAHTVDIPPSQAYGLYSPEMALERRLSDLPGGVEVGTTLVGQDKSGERLRFEVVSIEPCSGFPRFNAAASLKPGSCIRIRHQSPGGFRGLMPRPH